MCVICNLDTDGSVSKARLAAGLVDILGIDLGEPLNDYFTAILSMAECAQNDENYLQRMKEATPEVVAFVTASKALVRAMDEYVFAIRRPVGEA